LIELTKSYVSIPTKEKIRLIKSKYSWTSKHDSLQIQLNTIVPNTHLTSHDNDGEVIDSILKNCKPETLSVHELHMELSNFKEIIKCITDPHFVSRSGIKKVCIGLALTLNGLWKIHAWGHNYFAIVEVTYRRAKYIPAKIIVLD
jgi:hypothetical protein